MTPALTPTLLAEGFCFGEGPRWRDGLLWFSDMLGEAAHTVSLRGTLTTIPLPGHRPSGLGFGPDGALLIVSTAARQILRYDGESLRVAADLGDLAPADLGDMVIDGRGRAYVGSQARQGGVIIRVDPDGSARVVAGDLEFPNGMAILPDGATFVVAESTARRLSAYTLDDGILTGRRVFADGLSGPPDGVAVDANGGVWTALTLAHEFARITDGGTVTHRIGIGERIAIACALDDDQRTLFLVSTTEAYPERLIGTTLSQVHRVELDGAHHV